VSTSSLQVRPFPADDVVSIGSLSHSIFISGAVIRPQPLVTSTTNGSFKHSSSQTSKPLLTWIDVAQGMRKAGIMGKSPNERLHNVTEITRTQISLKQTEEKECNFEYTHMYNYIRI